VALLFGVTSVAVGGVGVMEMEGDGSVWSLFLVPAAALVLEPLASLLPVIRLRPSRGGKVVGNSSRENKRLHSGDCDDDVFLVEVVLIVGSVRGGGEIWEYDESDVDGDDGDDDDGGGVVLPVATWHDARLNMTTVLQHRLYFSTLHLRFDLVILELFTLDSMGGRLIIPTLPRLLSLINLCLMYIMKHES